MKKVALFMFTAAVVSSYSMFASAGMTPCQMRCFESWDNCYGQLPAYKCDQIYKTCLRSCGG